jgi:hypothetical protein
MATARSPFGSRFHGAVVPSDRIPKAFRIVIEPDNFSAHVSPS